MIGTNFLSANCEASFSTITDIILQNHQSAFLGKFLFIKLLRGLKMFSNFFQNITKRISLMQSNRKEGNIKWCYIQLALIIGRKNVSFPAKYLFLISCLVQFRRTFWNILIPLIIISHCCLQTAWIWQDSVAW